MANPILDNIALVTRRQMFGTISTGIGLAALASLTGSDSVHAADRGLPGMPHFPAKAKRVVVLWQGGGPSHVDLFDHKPMLRQMAGRDIPDSVRGTTRLSTMSSGYGKWPCQPAIKPFRRYGQAGIPFSEMLPNKAKMVDDMVEPGGSSRPRGQNVLVKAFGEDPPAAQHGVAVKSARHDGEPNRLACHRQVRQAARIPAMNPI